MVARQLSTGLG
uniref:Uncharacterized protein n=1 Tax=Arundo donax TaxID=35708 RepID=A0A0A9HK65_ARUDO